MDASQKNANKWLLNHFEKKCLINPKYSLRAFAQRLQVSPGRLSEYFSEKRTITPKAARKIIENLGLSFTERQTLINSLSVQRGSPQTQSSLKTKNGGLSIDNRMQKQKYITISEDHFSIIADWYHFAILSLMQTKSFRSDIGWISERLGLSTSVTRSALQRLERVELIKREANQYKPTHNNLITTSDIESSALKVSHKQSLEQAIDCLYSVSVSERHISSATIAIKKNRLKLAKQMIRNFRTEFMKAMESSAGDEVYNLNLQFVPVTKINNKQSKGVNS